MDETGDAAAAAASRSIGLGVGNGSESSESGMEVDTLDTAAAVAGTAARNR